MKYHGYHIHASTHEYNGFSMWPTLRPGDGLVVEQYGEHEPIKKGNVVLFFDPGRQQNVVHRVISVNKTAIRTRGDNNSQIDTGSLQRSDIIGKVVAVFRKDRIIAIPNGMLGRSLGLAWRIRRALAFSLCRIGGPLYRRLVKSTIFRIPPQWLQLQVLTFQKHNGTKMILRIWRRWDIGIYHPEKQHWQIYRPFRPFIDLDALNELIEHS